MRFAILGTTRAWRADGAEVGLGGPARRALLACLLLAAGEPMPRDRLIDLLYGEEPPENAGHALQAQVSRLRRSGIPVVLSPAGYLLPVEPEAVDWHRFTALADAGRQALNGDEAAPAAPGRAGPARAAALLREALALWAEPADVPARLVPPMRERWLAAVEDRVEADLLRGAHREVIAELGELTARHPLRERLRGQLMRALHADGRTAEALVVFERVRRTLAGELGADPSPELAVLHRDLLRGEHRAPALHVPLTSFVGRDADVTRVRELLASARLVTLLGPGGAGKTRLAVEVARDRPDVCLAELAAVTSGADLPRAVLAALGVRASALLTGPGHEPSPADRLAAAIGDRPLLLVLDNCEHLVAEAAALAGRLLGACPGLRVLATSREPLAVTGEHLWPVRPLTPEDAVRLFTERAAAVRPGFVPDEAVTRICTALDGLPLAIELAAARMRTHDAAEIADRLAGQDRFRVLTRGSRTADARHRTLRAVVEWSWDLLTDAEREMAMTLTVFPGGATAEAAARVHSPALPVWDAEEILESLAGKSFAEASGGRYRMLETIRAFCRERLGEAAHERQRAHAAHFLALAEAAEPHLRGGAQLIWLDRLAAEHDNLRGALLWAAEAGEVRLGMRLLGAQATYLWIRGSRDACAGAAEALLAAAGPEPDPELGDDYVLCALSAPGGPHRWPAAASLVRRGAGARHRPLVVYLWPMVHAGERDQGTTLAVLRRAETSPDPWERAVCAVLWAYPRVSAGDVDTAAADLAAALDGFRALGDRWGAALAHDALAWLSEIRGDPAAALACTEAAIELAEQLGATEDLADLLCNRGLHRLRDDLAAARADFGRAAGLARRSGLRTYEAAALGGLGDAAFAEGDLAGARRLYEQALTLSDPEWVRSAASRTRLLTGLGRVARAEGDPAAARAAYAEAVTAAIALGAVPECSHVLEALAALESDAGGDREAAERAARLLGAATAARGTPIRPVADTGHGAVTAHAAETARAAAWARRTLGPEAYERARAHGAGLGIEDTCRLAGVPEDVIADSPLRTLMDLSGEWPVSRR